MRQIFNFSPGPAMLPEEVLLQAQEELLDWQETGMSVMELSHRLPIFEEKIVAESESDLRELMAIPKTYQILFLSGGATTQFAMVPLNLSKKTGMADYIDTGIWSKKAIQEAQRYANISIAASVKKVSGLLTIPEQQEWHLNKQASYLHYTPNETIEGVEFNWVPQTNQDIPLVADMSSMILSREIDVTQYGIIYASAQKNIGQAGITLVIIRDDLINTQLPSSVPSMYQYHTHSKYRSLYNTPPTYSWYLLRLMLAWTKRQGGVTALQAVNQQKAAKLYQCIDQNPDFYRSTIHPACRSKMNVSFSLPTEELTTHFLAQAKKAGLMNLKGHSIFGGIRASIYNAMPEAGIDALIQFMNAFASNQRV